MGEKIDNGDYVREYFQVPAHIGARVYWRGAPGIIKRFDLAYIVIALDYDPLVEEPREVTVHPTWEVDYGTSGEGSASMTIECAFDTGEPTGDPSGDGEEPPVSLGV